jgi:hypothetical protein
MTVQAYAIIPLHHSNVSCDIRLICSIAYEGQKKADRESGILTLSAQRDAPRGLNLSFFLGAFVLRRLLSTTKLVAESLIHPLALPMTLEIPSTKMKMKKTQMEPIFRYLQRLLIPPLNSNLTPAPTKTVSFTLASTSVYRTGFSDTLSRLWLLFSTCAIIITTSLRKFLVMPSSAPHSSMSSWPFLQNTSAGPTPTSTA